MPTLSQAGPFTALKDEFEQACRCRYGWHAGYAMLAVLIKIRFSSHSSRYANACKTFRACFVIPDGRDLGDGAGHRLSTWCLVCYLLRGYEILCALVAGGPVLIHVFA